MTNDNYRSLIGETLYTLNGNELEEKKVPKEGKIEKMVRKGREFYNDHSAGIKTLAAGGMILFGLGVLNSPKNINYQSGIYMGKTYLDGQEYLLLDSTSNGGRYVLKKGSDSLNLKDSVKYNFKVEEPFIGDDRAVEAKVDTSHKF